MDTVMHWWSEHSFIHHHTNQKDTQNQEKYLFVLYVFLTPSYVRGRH